MRIAKSHRRGWLLGLAALAGIGLMAGAASAGSAEEPAASDSRPLIVKIHADWCGTCQRLVPTFAALAGEIGSEARIVVLDVTDEASANLAAAEAERLGIRGFFDAYRSKTGTVGVIDAAGRTVSVTKGEMDPAKYVEAVRKAQAGGSA